MCAFAPYDMEHVKVIGYDVVLNRPKVAAYRAPGAPIAEYAVECVIDEIAKKLEIDPVELRLKNAAKEGTKAAYGPKFGVIGLIDTLEEIKAHEHYNAPLGPNQGRGVASGFWFNIGGETCVTMNVNEDGTATLVLGTPDIGGSRASMCLMAAEALGIDYEKVRPIIGDTSALGYTFLTGGSRVTFSSGIATVDAANVVTKEMCARAAKIWDIPIDAVVWEDGHAKPAGANAGDFDPMSFAEIAKMAGKTGGPIVGSVAINAQGAAPAFGTHLVDVEVDKETGRVNVIRYTVAQDAGRAIHPSYVEGQFQWRCRPGHRLGAERGVHLRRRWQPAERRFPRLPDSGGLRRADDRYDHRRGVGIRPIPMASAASARCRLCRPWRPSPTRSRRRPAFASPSCRCRRPRCCRRSTRRPTAAAGTTSACRPYPSTGSG